MQNVYLTILGMTAVTYLLRAVPLLLLNKAELPPVVLSWLRLIPPAVLGALTAQSIFLRGTAVTFRWNNIYLLAALPCFAIALKTKSLLWTIAVGLVSVIILNQFKPALF
ncbi:MAG TPA: AzlD domain-containing protein [Desulfobacteria bacterium]|nr:AzlD domain-containing protein [Desulfobacteria bacterium]